MKMGSFQGQTSTEDYVTNNDKNNSTSSPTVTGKVTAISLLSELFYKACSHMCQSKYGLHKTQVANVKMPTFTYESHGLYSLPMSPLASKTVKNKI